MVKADTLTKQSSSYRVFQVLRDRIVSGIYVPGSLMSEKDILEEFKVSRTPYRTALQQLEAMSLVKIIPRYGTIVSEIDLNEIISAYEVRLRLETMAAELSAQRRNEEDIAEFQKYLSKFAPTEDARDVIRETKIDTHLHELTCKASKNQILTEYLYNLRLICSRIWTTSWWNNYDLGLMKEHWKIMWTCWETKNSQEASTVMNAHIQHSIDILKSNVFTSSHDNT